ncbi:MAG: GrpB family protein [Saprospiraceae bacterium]|nr:GrpB family protein [Saprospiraceae bacterium]
MAEKWIKYCAAPDRMRPGSFTLTGWQAFYGVRKITEKNGALPMINFIQPYDPAWKTEFEDFKRVLEGALNGMDVDVQHVGSTAVAGLVAKPILDIDVIVEDKFLLNAISSRLKKLGYLDKGEQGIPGRFAFRQTSDHTPVTANNKKWQTHHLYVCFSDAPALKNHLFFRDALLGDEDLVKTYAALKTTLVAEVE